MSAASALGVFVKLFLLLTPFFVLSVFVTTCSGLEKNQQRKLAIRVAAAVLTMTCVLYLFGEVIFRYLGITLDAFRIGAGLVLMLNGIDMVRGSGIPGNRALASGEDDPAVVPLAIPTTVGPGTIGTLLVMGAEASGFKQMVLEVSAIALASVCVGVMLLFSDYVERVLKKNGLSILTKLTGMYIVALAAQVIFTGVDGMLNGSIVKLIATLAAK